MDNYYYEGQRDAVFLGEHVVKYHRTLTTYLETLLRLGFRLEHVIEPKPPKELMHLDGMEDEMRRPMMLLIRDEKENIVRTKCLCCLISRLLFYKKAVFVTPLRSGRLNK